MKLLLLDHVQQVKEERHDTVDGCEKSAIATIIAEEDANGLFTFVQFREPTTIGSLVR